MYSRIPNYPFCSYCHTVVFVCLRKHLSLAWLGKSASSVCAVNNINKISCQQAMLVTSMNRYAPKLLMPFLSSMATIINLFSFVCRCTSCYKCYYDEASLNAHLRTHMVNKRVRNYRCEECGKTYTQVRLQEISSWAACMWGQLHTFVSRFVLGIILIFYTHFVGAYESGKLFFPSCRVSHYQTPFSCCCGKASMFYCTYLSSSLLNPNMPTKTSSTAKQVFLCGSSR